MAELISLDRFVDVLQAARREHVALIGGGGKTTLLHALGSQLGGSRVLTTTTVMGHDQHGDLPVVFPTSDGDVARAARNRAVIVWRRIEGQKAKGVAPEDCDRWFDLVDHVVVEADGARQRPFKAPAPYEPVVPATATLLVSVIGADALGRVIADQCHRPLRVAALAGCTPYERLSATHAASVLLHHRGALRAKPAGARLVVVINKVDDMSRRSVDELVDVLHERDRTLQVIAISRR